jgi:tetratricopeptide (TPR) repeat protein
MTRIAAQAEPDAEIGMRAAILRRSKFPQLLASMLALVAAAGALAHGDVHEQIEVLTRAIARTPSAELYLKRGELNRVHGDFGAALDDYESAEKLDPRMDAVWLCRGRALFESGHPETARVVLDEFLQRKPDHAEAHVVRARVHAKLGERRRALEDYDRAIALSAEPRPEHFVERATVLLELGEPDAALAGLEAAMTRLGEIPSLQLFALEAEVNLQRYDAALRRLDGVLARAERKEHWLAKRAEILAQAGRAAEAADAWRATLAAIQALPPRLREAPAVQALARRAHEADGPLSSNNPNIKLVR